MLAKEGYILIKRTCALGDLVLTLPFLFFLRRHRPREKFYFLGHDLHVLFLKKYRYIDQGSSIDTSNWHLLYVEGPTPWNRLRPDPRDFLELYLVGSEQENLTLRTSLEGRVQGHLRFITARPPVGRPVHAASFLMEQVPELCPEEAPLEEGFAPLRTARAPSVKCWTVLIHPGSGSPKKNWPAPRFARLTKALLREGHTRVLIVQGPQDAEPVRRLFEAGASGKPIFCEDMFHLIQILQGASLFIGNDSGPTHLAAAMGIPTVAIFGPSDPLQWSPIGGTTTVLYNTEAPCDPCHLSPSHTCKEEACLRFPSVEHVANEALTFLQGFQRG